MKKFIAVTSFLFIFLLAVLPSQASHAFAAANNAPSLTGISLVTDKGEIKAVKSGNSFKLNLAGVPGDLKVYKLVLTSSTAKTVSVFPENDEDLFDLQFTNGVAYLDVEKYNDWATRFFSDGQSESDQIPDLGKIVDRDYFFTVQELRTAIDEKEKEFSNLYGADANNNEYPSLYVADANGNETEITLTVAIKGWKLDKQWYYYDVNGNKKVGWLADGNKWYYLDKKTGAMQTGWLLDGSKWYFLDKTSGAMKTGWVLDKGKWYYLNNNGTMATGWVKVSNKWYYLNGKGDMATGWVKVSNKWYYLNNNGTMATGWVKVSNKWYYLNNNGTMATGWIQVSKKWYYLYSDGHMAANTKIGKYKVGKDGARMN